jgi:hypothetical protein
VNVVWVVAELRPGCEDPDGAVGVWEVTLDRSMEPGTAVGAALDIFHRKVGIGELEDFEISTVDPASREEIYESEVYQQGSCGNGCVELIAEELGQIT